ncbi:MAG: hypothetical protein EBT15_12275, partial [Betaproteobacteria bacterium]|nr:hypothetical protein [Betaproteobacteria bacterium]
GGSASYTGDGFSGLYLWGAQLEAGSFATSYIPTTSAAVTRNADAASMTGTNFSSWFNNGEGTIYAETTGYASGGSPKGIVSIGNYYSTANTMDVYYAASLTSVQLEMITNSVVQATIVASGQKTKVAAAYKFNDTNLGSDGSVGTTDTSCTIPVCTEIGFGTIYNGNPSYYANGRIKKIAYYPVRVTNAQLQALTA